MNPREFGAKCEDRVSIDEGFLILSDKAFSSLLASTLLFI
jgi:hypothetical protein